MVAVGVADYTEWKVMTFDGTSWKHYPHLDLVLSNAQLCFDKSGEVNGSGIPTIYVIPMRKAAKAMDTFVLTCSPGSITDWKWVPFGATGCPSKRSEGMLWTEPGHIIVFGEGHPEFIFFFNWRV